GDDDIVAAAGGELVPHAVDAHAARALGIARERRIARQTRVEIPLLLVPGGLRIASLRRGVLGVVRVGGDAGASAARRGRRWGAGKGREEAEGRESPERAGKRGSQYASPFTLVSICVGTIGR